MFNFLYKNSIHKIDRFFKKYQPSTGDWSLILINKRFVENSPINREIDLYQNKNFYQLKLVEKKTDDFFISIFKNQRKYVECDFQNSKETIDTFLIFIDLQIQNTINIFTRKLNEQKLISTTNLELEAKSLEWAKVSFKVLKDAIKSLEKEKSQAASLSLFMGINPKHQMPEIRIVIFNLDINYILLNDGQLRVRIYNDKTGEFKTAIAPALEGDFSHFKREFFEELIILLISIKPLLRF